MSNITSINWEQEKENLLVLGEQGKTLREIGDLYGVSKQRIKQVCTKLNISSDFIGTGFIRKRRQEAYKQKWGNRVDSDLYREQRAKFRGKKSNALNMGIPWEIKFGDLDWPTHCPVLGIEINYFSEGRSDASCSFDLIDADKGYIKDNVIIMSWRANRIKNNGSSDEHLKIAAFMQTYNL